MSDDRILKSLDALAVSAAAREGVPDPRYLAVWSYSVTSANQLTFSGRALSERCPMPDIPSVPNMPGVPGTLLQPVPGSIVGVAFLDGDPAKPRCVSWDATTPVSVGLAGGGPAVHRVGDKSGGCTVDTFPPGPSGTSLVFTNSEGQTCTIPIVFAAGVVTVGPAVLVPPTPTPFQFVSIATTGSTKVTSG